MKRFGVVLLATAMLATANRSTRALAEEMPAMSMPAQTDHAALAAMYEADARSLQQKVASHQLMLERYRNAPALPKGSPFPKEVLVNHCRKLVESYQQAAKDAQEMAKMEQQLAQAGTPK